MQLLHGGVACEAAGRQLLHLPPRIGGLLGRRRRAVGRRPRRRSLLLLLCPADLKGRTRLQGLALADNSDCRCLLSAIYQSKSCCMLLDQMCSVISQLRLSKYTCLPMQPKITLRHNWCKPRRRT